MNAMMPDISFPRRVRSFVRRMGRLSDRQKRGVESLSKYEINFNPKQSMVWADCFDDKAMRVLDIGFGMGHSLLMQAAHMPEAQFLGVDVHLPGVGALCAGLGEQGLSNVRVYADDVVPLIQHQDSAHVFDRVQLFCPDPWPKQKHHKRRLVQVSFLADIWRLTRPGAMLHLATDWQPYADHMLSVIAKSTHWQMAPDTIAKPIINARPRSQFQTRGERLGHVMTDWVLQRA